MGMGECSKKLPISPPDPQECFVKSMNMLVQANTQLLGLSVQNTDNCTSFCNKLYNYLDLMYLLNCTALAMLISYIVYQSSNETLILLEF